MASGTGLTTGPYNLAASSTIELDDPNARGGQVSDRVQIQNQSGFTVTVYSAGAPYTIPALQASTIPTAAGGQSLLLATSASTSATSGAAGGSVTAVWLLPEQLAPIPDGALIVGAAIGSVVVGSKTHPFTIVFPGPYVDNFSIDYTVQRMTMVISITGLGSGSLLVEVQGNNSSQVYYLKSFTTNAYTTATFSVFGSVDSSVQVNTSYTGLSSPSISYTLTATESASTSTDTVTYGGAQNIAVTGIAPGISSTLLGGPGSGLAYRLHSWSVNKAITVAADYLTLAASSSGTVFDIAVPSSPGKYLGGLILADGVVFKNASSTITFGVFLSYDLIISPLIS